MSEQAPTLAYDDFPWRQNYPSPWSRDQIRQYQERLDAITGKSATGASRLRLIWGADPDVGMMIYGGKKRFKYFVSETIALQRFVLEQLHEPAEYKPTWENNRYRWEGITRIDLKGDPPPDGIYSHFHTVAEHDHRCCNGTLLINGHQACYGFFGVPDENELALVQMAIRLRDRTPELRPGEKIPQAELEQELRETKYWEEYNREKTREEFRDILVDEFKTHQATIFSDDESVQKNGRFHWLSGHNKSGATLDEIAAWRTKNKERHADSDSDRTASSGQGVQHLSATETEPAAA